MSRPTIRTATIEWLGGDDFEIAVEARAGHTDQRRNPDAEQAALEYEKLCASISS